MKTTINLAIIFLASVVAYGGVLRVADLGPTTANIAAKNDPQTADITYAAPADATKRNCLTSLSVNASSPATLRVLSGTATTYTLALTSGTPFGFERGQDEAICAAAGASLAVKVTTAGPGPYTINTQGFIY